MNLLELESQAIVSHLTWVQEDEPEFSGRAVGAFNRGAISGSAQFTLDGTVIIFTGELLRIVVLKEVMSITKCNTISWMRNSM